MRQLDHHLLARVKTGTARGMMARKMGRQPCVYLVALVKIRNRTRFAKYEIGLLDGIRSHGGRVLAVDENPRAIEGVWPYDRTVLLRFPSTLAFKKWYGSRSYQALLQHRLASATAQIVLVGH